jgi:hypothetical protein
VHHFKWTATVRERLEKRVAAYSSGAWRVLVGSVTSESQRFLDHLSAHGGLIDITDPEFLFTQCGSTYWDYPHWQLVPTLLGEWDHMDDRLWHWSPVDAP